MNSASIVLAGLLAIFPAGLEACEMGGALHHPVEIYRKFGFSKHPMLQTVRLHSGVDYKGAKGDPVAAAEAGIVAVAERLQGRKSIAR